jgi:hypothetical protein
MARLASRADGRDRAQTAHDFALGMGVFLLAVAFVFATLPTLATPYEGNGAEALAPRAERVAATAVHHLSADGGTTRLDSARTAAFFRNESSGDDLRRFFGLPPLTSINVSVRNGSGVVRATADDGSDVPLVAGDRATGRPPTTAVRVVTLANESACRPTCRLRVEVW